MTKATMFVRFADVLVRLKERKKKRTKGTPAVCFPSQMQRKLHSEVPQNNERRAFSS